MTSIAQVIQQIRPHILQLQPYSSARDEFSGKADVYLDANENPFGSPLLNAVAYHRYPDPHQSELKQLIATSKGISADQIFLGNGSDEAIDLLIRLFCEPNQDSIIICPPTYGMYAVSAAIHNVKVQQIPLLTPNFTLDTQKLMQAMPQSKILWLCSPNNPTGNLLSADAIEQLLRHDSACLVVVDEAYIDFSTASSWLCQLHKHPKLVVLQTFSKAWGMAGLRLGMAFAHPAIIALLDKIKPPYNINAYTQRAAMQALQHHKQVSHWVEQIRHERERLTSRLQLLACVEHIYPSEANFILVRFKQAANIFQHLMQKGIIVRDRSNAVHCHNCLRISIGKPEENDRLLQALEQW